MSFKTGDMKFIDSDAGIGELLDKLVQELLRQNIYIYIYQLSLHAETCWGTHGPLFRKGLISL